MPSLLRQDYERLRDARGWRTWGHLLGALLFDNGFQAVVLFRLASWFKRRRWPFFGPFFARLSILLTGVEIAPGAEIGPGLLISHGHGIVIGHWVKIGRNVILHHQVTIGAVSLRRLETMPVLEDGVFVGAGAKLLGGITIGSEARIGANAVVTRDIPAGSTVMVKGGLHVVPPAQEASARDVAASRANRQVFSTSSSRTLVAISSRIRPYKLSSSEARLRPTDGLHATAGHGQVGDRIARFDRRHGRDADHHTILRRFDRVQALAEQSGAWLRSATPASTASPGKDVKT